MTERARGHHWNYRMTVQKVDGEEVWDIRELHYDAEDRVIGWTADPVGPHGSSWRELREDLLRMSKVVGKPAFDLDTRRWRAPRLWGRKR